MKKFFQENISLKLITMLVVAALVVPGAYFIWPPKPAKADFSACLPIFTSTLALVFGTGAVNVPVQPTEQGESVGESMSNLIENCVEQGIALSMGKIILSSMTNEIVNWINSGFQGSPAFVTNPSGFFENVADNVAGNIIAGSGLAFLCSPFSLQEKLALALNFSLSIGSNESEESSCTLSQIVGNSTNAVNNFVNDFSQGGWAAYYGISLDSQNNPYGSFLQADASIQSSIDTQQGIESQKLDWGTGFQSTQTCTDPSGTALTGDESDTQADLKNAQAQLTALQNDPNADEENESEIGTLEAQIASDTQVLSEYDNGQVTCTIDTPGHTIASVLDKQLGVPVDQLGVADDLDKIFNALGYELVTLALEKGLGGNGGSQTYSNTNLANAAIGSTNYGGYQGTATGLENPIVTSLPINGTTAPTSTNTTSTAPDPTLPSITLNGTNPLVVGIGSTFTDPGYTVAPSAGNTITNQASNGVVTTANAGVYHIVYTVTDSSGASNTLTRTVIVDNPPTITLNPWQGNTTPLYINSRLETYQEPGATASDAIDGNISSKVVISGTATSGTNTITYSVTDPTSGLSATITRTVIVQ